MDTIGYIFIIFLFTISIIGSVVYIISNKHIFKSFQDIKIAISAAVIGCIFAISMLVAHLFFIANVWRLNEIVSFILLRQYEESMLFSRMFIVGVVLAVSGFTMAIVAYVQLSAKKNNIE